MNIFVTSYCPEQCAWALDDKRLVKMVLETAQMISTVMRSFGITDSRLYKSTHKNHPCTRWTSESLPNFCWTLTHGIALAEEYTHRYGKTHKSATIFDTAREWADIIAVHLPSSLLTEHVIATAWGDLKELNPVDAYREMMRRKWAQDEENGRPPKWTLRGAPEWR